MQPVSVDTMPRVRFSDEQIGCAAGPPRRGFCFGPLPPRFWGLCAAEYGAGIGARRLVCRALRRSPALGSPSGSAPWLLPRRRRPKSFPPRASDARPQGRSGPPWKTNPRPPLSHGGTIRHTGGRFMGTAGLRVCLYPAWADGWMWKCKRPGSQRGCSGTGRTCSFYAMPLRGACRCRTWQAS